jgi:hypothetical protein
VDLHDLRVVVRARRLEQARAERAAELDEAQQRLTGPRGVHRGPVSGDHPTGLQASDALGDGGRREVHAAAERVVGLPAVGLQLGEQPPVDVVELERS